MASPLVTRDDAYQQKHKPGAIESLQSVLLIDMRYPESAGADIVYCKYSHAVYRTAMTQDQFM